MTMKAAGIVILPAVLTVAALTVRAQVTAERPGVMTPSQVWVQNRGAGEAVPVTLAAPEVVAVRLAEGTALSFAPGTAVSTHAAQQRWEYRTEHVASGQDAAEALRNAGQQGWEAVGVASSDPSGTTFLLKRPAN